MYDPRCWAGSPTLGAWFLVFKLEIADNEYPLFENRSQNPALTDGVRKDRAEINNGHLLSICASLDFKLREEEKN